MDAHRVDGEPAARKREALHVAPLGAAQRQDPLLRQHVQRLRVDSLLVDQHEALAVLAHLRPTDRHHVKHHAWLHLDSTNLRRFTCSTTFTDERVEQRSVLSSRFHTNKRVILQMQASKGQLRCELDICKVPQACAPCA